MPLSLSAHLPPVGYDYDHRFNGVFLWLPFKERRGCGDPRYAPKSHKILIRGPRLGVGETSFLKTRRFEARNGKRDGIRDEKWARNGNDTEFETRNGRKWETRQYKIHHFSTKNEKNGKKLKKLGEKH